MASFKISFKPPGQSLAFTMSPLAVGGRFQSKPPITPSEVEQTITPDAGYDGLSSVTVAAIPSNYGKITYSGYELLVS